MADYDTDSNADRVERRQQLERDAGATHQQIHNAARSFAQRISDRITDRTAEIARNQVTQGFADIKTSTTIVPIAPLTLGVPTNGSDGQEGPPGQQGDAAALAITNDDGFLLITEDTPGIFKINLAPQGAGVRRVLGVDATGAWVLYPEYVCS